MSTSPDSSSTSLVFTLGIIAILSGVLVVFAHQLTQPRIEANKLAALEQAVFGVLPGAETRKNFSLTDEGLTPLEDSDIAGSNLFAGYDASGNLVGVAMEASSRGYQDVVRILYGYIPDTGCIVGFRILQSTETPGLGDRVGKDPGFLANFNCLEARVTEDGSAMAHEIRTVKHGTKTDPWQIDGISGATVTSMAIGRALNDSTSRMLPNLFRHFPLEDTP